jgi:hypothetical protein
LEKLRKKRFALSLQFLNLEKTKMPSAHAKRLDWALKAYGHLLVAAVRQDTSTLARDVEAGPEAQMPERVAHLILEQADPTMAKTMTAWLVRQYSQGRLRLEDLGTANETLEMFQRHAPRLPEAQRDLGRYQSLAEVWEAVFVLAETEKDRLSSKAQKSLDRDRAYAESRILRQDEDGFTIAVPLTEFASKWWGRGTRWCSAGEKGNAFLEYHQEAPLIVVAIPELKEEGKFQIWATESDFQFMDAGDEPVSEALVAGYWPRFEPIISFALRQNGQSMKYVPNDLRTEELCKFAVHHDGIALKYVPDVLRTQEMCRIAVSHNGRALEHVPKKRRTVEICRIAVAQNGRALAYVPERLCAEEICKIAVTRNGGSLQYVPWDLRTEEICRRAVAHDGWALQYVPRALRTKEMCCIAVARAGFALKHVPADLLTEKVCRIAVAQKGNALGYAPKILRTKVMCRIAVAQNGYALGDVPQKLLTEEICRIAVAQNGLALEHVPEQQRTEETYRIALGQNGWALQCIPEALRSEELCRIAVGSSGTSLCHVPAELRTEDMCRNAVAKNGGALYWAPKHLCTEELCRIAVAQDGTALRLVPQHLQPVVKHFARQPVTTTWDMSLLDELATFIRVPSDPELSGPRYA